MKDDKSLLITLVWLLITLVLIAWTTYQSWYWFVNYKMPRANASSSVVSSELKVVSGPSNDSRLQDAARIQVTGRVQ